MGQCWWPLGQTQDPRARTYSGTPTPTSHRGAGGADALQRPGDQQEGVTPGEGEHCGEKDRARPGRVRAGRLPLRPTEPGQTGFVAIVTPLFLPTKTPPPQ